MRITYFIVGVFLSMSSFAGHIGCVTHYDKSLCEAEQTIQFKSDDLNWEMPKDVFKEKIKIFLDQLLPGHSIRMGAVFLWVNDFNSQSSLRVQVWELGRSAILDVPTDLNSITQQSDVTIRGAGALPYPLDFGITLGELIISCHEDCNQDHTNWLKQNGISNIRILLPKMQLVSVPLFSEAKTVETIKATNGFEKLFRGIEVSPILEGNGYRELAFTIFF